MKIVYIGVVPLDFMTCRLMEEEQDPLLTILVIFSISIV